MPRYNISKEATIRCVFSVDAKDEKEAMEKIDRAYQYDWDFKRIFFDAAGEISCKDARPVLPGESIDPEEIIEFAEVAWNESK